MRTYEELKHCLVQIKDSGYNVPDGLDVDGLIDDMLRFIGHTDPELRDSLIEKTIMQWAEAKRVFSPDQMRHILYTCLGDTHLFFGIGEKDTDSVFTRAYSSLAISAALCMHDETPFLTADDVQTIKEAALRYANEEKDYRNYVDGKGWADAVAHIADVLVNVSCCPVDDDYSIGREGMSEILQAVKALVCNNEHIYIAMEDERLVTTVCIAVDLHKFTAKELIDWIDSFDMTDNEYWKGTMPDDYYLYVNKKNFMKSLYFKLQGNLSIEGFDEICKYILSFLT